VQLVMCVAPLPWYTRVAIFMASMLLTVHPLLCAVEGISAQPYADNMRYFDVTIEGPPDSPYAGEIFPTLTPPATDVMLIFHHVMLHTGGIFKLELYLSDDYPMSAPKVRFLTKCFHPNIDRLGRICLDILKDRYAPLLMSAPLAHVVQSPLIRSSWSPALQIRTVLLSIQALLSSPNPDDPLDNGMFEIRNTHYQAVPGPSPCMQI